jgi:hypothetical protein
MVRRLIAVDETVLKVNVMIVEVILEMKERMKRSCSTSMIFNVFAFMQL